MSDRNSVFRYLLNGYFHGDIEEISYKTGFKKSDLIAWRDDVKTPQQKSLVYLLNVSITPEFKVVFEFVEIDSNNPIFPQLKTIYQGHEHRSGIYAFYDGMANLVYIGKAKNLLGETYSALGRNHEIVLPAGIKNKDTKRYHVVRYVSAYEVKIVNGFDYPKHVESLLLRISKPIMNKQIGHLEPAYPELDDDSE